MRLIIPLALAVAYVGWVGYHLLVKRDLKEHLNEVYFGLFFFGIWGLIYWFIFT